MNIDPNNLKVEVLHENRTGMYVGVTRATVKVTHLPTGVSVECGDFRSAHENRYVALKHLQHLLDNTPEQQYNPRL